MFVYKHSLCIFLALMCLTVTLEAANIMDLLEWSLMGKDSAEVRAEEDAAPGGQRNCLCDGSSCICCIDFNLTFIDLGGPGCVRMKYLSQEEGFAINISYGNSLIHNQTVKGPDPEPICMNLISKVAQLCAKITELAPTSDGLRGCVSLEPTLLGDPTLEFPIGCFKSGVNGMVMEPIKVESNDTGVSPTAGQKPPGISPEDIIQGVNESVEEGFAFISNLFGLTFGNSTDTDEEEDEISESPAKPNVESTSQAPVENSSPAASRGSKTMRFRSKANEI